MKIKFMASLFFALLAINYSTADAQETNWKWVKSAGGSGDDRGNSVAADKNGNIITTGRFRSRSIAFGKIILINSDTSGSDIFITKYDPEGNAVWARSAGGKGDDMGEFCSTDVKGNIIVTGWFECPQLTFGKYTLTNAGKKGSDFFIVKYSPDGNVLWAKSAGGTGSEGDYSTCATDRQGNIIIQSTFYSPSLAIDSVTLVGPGVLIAKFSPDGKLIWVKSVKKDGGSMEGQSCAADTEGNIVVGGYFSGPTLAFGSVVLKNAGVKSADVFVVKYTPEGEVRWAKSIGDSNMELGTCSMDPEGNVLVAGMFFSPTLKLGKTTLTNKGQANIFVVKLSPNGEVLWAKSAGGSSFDGARKCFLDKNGNALVIGSFSSPSVTFDSVTLQNHAGNKEDLFIAEYSLNGKLLWVKSAGGSGRNVGRGCCSDANGNVIATGSFDAPVISFGPFSLNNSGSSDVFIGKLGKAK